MTDNTYQHIPEKIQGEFEKIPQARQQLENYRSAQSNNLKAIYGGRLFEYATHEIWMKWYQYQFQAKGGKAKSAKKAVSSAANGKKGGRPKKWKTAKEKNDHFNAKRRKKTE